MNISTIIIVLVYLSSLYIVYLIYSISYRINVPEHSCITRMSLAYYTRMSLAYYTRMSIYGHAPVTLRNTGIANNITS